MRLDHCSLFMVSSKSVARSRKRARSQLRKTRTKFILQLHDKQGCALGCAREGRRRRSLRRSEDARH